MKLIALNNVHADLDTLSAAFLTLNDKTSRYGLFLTPSQARELAALRERALRENERVEIGIGAPALLAETFAASSYVSPDNWAETLCGLCEIFYYAKSKLCDRVSDRELASVMFKFFENNSQGSLELLSTRELESFLRGVLGDSYHPFDRRNFTGSDTIDDRIGRAGAYDDDDRDHFNSLYELDPEDNYSLTDCDE